MNIYILNHYGEPPTIGKNIRHYQFAKKLIERGHIVKIFTASTIHTTDINYIKNDESNYKELIIENVPFVFVKTCDYYGNGKKRVLNFVQYAYRVLGLIKKLNLEKPDIIYASSAHPLTWLSGYRISEKYNAKFIAETRDLWPETLVVLGNLNRKGLQAKVLYSIEKFIYRKADKLIFTFPGGKEYVAKIGLNTDKVEYINNGVDLNEFYYNKEHYTLNDDDLIDDSFFKVLYTGTMGLSNSLDSLMEAAKIIAAKGNNKIKFILYGDGVQRQKLEEYTRINNLSNVYFKGKVERKYIPYILSMSDLNVFNGKNVSLYKYGLSLNKMFEYFASGKPTLSNIECGYDILKEYNSGITIKGGSAEALANGIQKFYNMPHDKYNEYCKNAITASKDFDFEILTDKLEKVLFN